MATLDDAIQAVQDILFKALRGDVRAAPVYPPESLNVFPFVVAYPGSGVYTPGAGWAVALHDIIVEVHGARKDLSNAAKAMYPFADSIPTALMADVTFGGTVQTFQAIDRTPFSALNWGDTETVGFRFTIRGVKLHM